MKRSPANIRKLALLALALGAVAVSCADMMAEKGTLDGACYDVVESISETVQRSAPARLTSADGVFAIDVPPQAVSTATEITISKLAPICAGQPTDDTRYVIAPETLVFERPVRVAFKIGALSSRRQPERLRVARLTETGAAGESWRALERPERTSGEVLGRSRRAGRFALVDTDATQISGVSPFSETSEADVLLSRGEVEAARAAFRAALHQSAESARAHLGFAVSSLLLLPDTSPVRNALARCGLPPLAPATIYGDAGFLDLLARDRGGTSELQMDFGASSSHSIAESVVARASASAVTLQVEDRDHIDGPWRLTVSIDLTAAGEAFRAGGVLTAAAFPGAVELTGPNGTYELRRATGGQVRVEAAGRAAGQEIALGLTGLALVNGASATVLLDGSVRDVIAAAPAPGHALFATADDPGPPYRRAAAVLLDDCSDALTGPFLFEQARALLDELSEIETSLDTVLAKLAASDPGTVQEATLALQQALPSFLLRLPDDVPLDPRDLRLLIAAVDVLRVALDVAAPYRFLGHDDAGAALPLAGFLADQTLAYTAADGSIATRVERALSASLLAADLSRNLLAPIDGGADLVAALSSPRLALLGALVEAVEALSQPAEGRALFDLDSPLASPFVDALVGAVTDFRDTLPAGASPIEAPGNAGYSFLARLFFDQPPTNEALAAQLPEGALCMAEPGAADAETAAGRNPRLTLSAAARPALLATFMTVPPDRSGSTCVDTVDCASAGVVCEFALATCQNSGEPCPGGPGSCGEGDSCIGNCARAPFVLIPTADVERALGGDAPALIDSELWRVIGPLLEVLPWRDPI
ncbi:MAG: hypothetical protein JXR83_08440 [Deltaproteobacteria bacterium]|nr:hypothetical protein [Deltaproteobacteria bacterium]